MTKSSLEEHPFFQTKQCGDFFEILKSVENPELRCLIEDIAYELIESALNQPPTLAP